MGDISQSSHAADDKSAGSSPTKQERYLAMLIWLSGLFLGLVPRLVFYLVKRKTPGWLLEQTKESLNFEITILIFCLAVPLMLILPLGIILLPAIPVILILNLVVSIRGAAKAYCGESYRFPAALHFVK